MTTPRTPTPTRRRRHRRRGELSAGRVLGIVVGALVLAALINADGLVERAERKPLGSSRDRSLAIWHPVQDVSHVLQLYRLRDLAQAVTGDDSGSHRAASAVPTTTAPPGDDDGRATTTTTEPPRRPVLRAPTSAAPLRVWAGGDSMMRDLSESIQRLAAGDARLAVTAHYEISSGLTRPDYYDWPGALAADVAATDPEVMFVLFGANDAQGIIAPDGTVHQDVDDPGWQAEYARRVELVMDQLRAEDDHRLVFWILQPPMRSTTFDGHIRILDDIYRAAAGDRPWIQLVETAPLFGDADGGFADELPGADGDLEDLRQDDGIHLARAGADKLARHLLDLIDAELSSAPGDATTSTTSTTDE